MGKRSGALLLALCAASVSAQTVLSGAGATFPEPLYKKLFRAFEERSPGCSIHYQATGSEAGIRALREGAADFAASDMPLEEQQLAGFGRRILQLPAAVGAVVPIYHVDGLPDDLRFTPEALAGIYLGRLKRWNDPAIQSSNRGVRLPDHEIVVIHRSDGSGTTFVFTDYLSKVSPEWKTIGVGTSVPWPAGAGAEHNEGVAEAVRGTPFSFGYVEYIYALFNRLSCGLIRNPAGRFVRADLESIAAAARNSAQSMPPNFRISITAAAGGDSYPITAFTYLLVPARNADPEKDQLLKALLEWLFTSGQRQSAALGYGSLPPEIVSRAQSAIASMR